MIQGIISAENLTEMILTYGILSWFAGDNMHITDELVPGASAHTGPVLVYLTEGRVQGGFILREDEFVTSITALNETRKLAGLDPASFSRSQTDL